MEKLGSLFFVFVTFFSQLFGLAGSAEYQKQTGVKEALNAVKEKQTILQTAYTGEPSAEVFDPAAAFTPADAAVVKKEKGRDFVVLNLTDTHFSDYDYRAWFAFEGSATVRRMVAETNPDLITVTGDIVCGDSTVYSVKRFTDLMESFGVPWAPVFGNHDDEANCDLNYLADIMLRSPHCVLRKGDPRMGVGNYVILVSESPEEETPPITEALIMMDSHHSQPNALQREWFSWAADGVNALSGGKAEIAVMMHIPLPEYQLAYDEAWNEEKKTWNDGYAAAGALHEEICCDRTADGEPNDQGFFDRVLQAGTVKHVICGHEHMNDFSIVYKGVRLTYTMKLGYGSGFQVGFNGGTVIRVGDKGISRITHKTVSYGVTVPVMDVRI